MQLLPPFDLVLFGGTGDLAMRKLLPAMYRRKCTGQMTPDSRVIGAARGELTRDEYLASRRKAYAKLDANGDGRLSFDEWAAKTTTKFATADKGRDGALDAAEFATTAVKRKAGAKNPNEWPDYEI